MSTATAPQQQSSLAVRPVDNSTVMTVPELRGFTASKVDLVRDALPEKMKGAAPRYMLTLIQACQEDERLRNCTAFSLLAGLIKVASYGLELGKEAYLIPRSGKATMQLGYGGVAALCERHPKVLGVGVGIVREGDEFEVIGGSEPKINHRPKRGNLGEPREFYAVVKLRNGHEHHCVMTVAEIDEHRKKFSDFGTGSGGARKGTWAQHFNAMASKTVLIGACKYAPKSIELPDWSKVEGEADEAMIEKVETIDAEQLPPAQQEQLRQVEANDAAVEPAAAAVVDEEHFRLRVVAEVERLAVAVAGSWDAVRQEYAEAIGFVGTRAKDLDVEQAVRLRSQLRKDAAARDAAKGAA